MATITISRNMNIDTIVGSLVNINTIAIVSIKIVKHIAIDVWITFNVGIASASRVHMCSRVDITSTRICNITIASTINNNRTIPMASTCTRIGTITLVHMITVDIAIQVYHICS